MQSIDALQTVRGTQMEGTRHAKLFDNGVAVVDLIGPIFPRANMMTMSGATSIAQFTQDFVKAEAHSDVTGIVINIDSPGGDVRGIGDAAKIIAEVTARSKKPIKAFVSGYMASAAYYIGSAVGPKNIISSESGLVGSIGVVLNGKAKGKDEIEIVSSQSPYKRPDGTSEEGRSVMQQQVDDLAEIFVRDVAKYRNVSQAKVLADYGQGQVLVAPRALKQGLVDKIGILSQVVDMVSGSKGPRRNLYQASVGDSVSALLQFSEEDNNMGLREMIDRFRADDDNTIEEPVALDEQAPDATTGEESETEDTPVVAEGQDTPEPQPDQPMAPEGIQTDVVANAQAQQPTREELEERFSDSAQLFALECVTTNTVFPSHAAYVASDLLTAKIDDILFGGTVKHVDEQGQLAEGTREAAVRARYKALPKHTMTQQAIAGIRNGTVAAKVLGESPEGSPDDNGPISAARKAELLALSQQGQAVLNAQAK
jgi:ClpP class serine protease